MQRLQKRALATVADDATSSVVQNARTHAYRIVVVGGGAAGQAVSHQLARSGVFSQEAGAKPEILVIDPAEFHDYQPGWTLVGAGLTTKEEGRRPMKELFEAQEGASPIDWLRDAVETFEPEKNQLKTRDGRTIQYEHLAVCPGIHINWSGIEGLEQALKEPKTTGVASIYGYVSMLDLQRLWSSKLTLPSFQDSCSDVFPLINDLEKGKAIFTQPAGVIKCAGAPQKAMWLALDHWKKAGQFSPTDASRGVQVSFISGMPTMFAQPKYSKVLDDLRKERHVEGLFDTNLTKIDAKRKVATFSRGQDQSPLEREYDLLHVTPPMGPLPWIKASPLAAKDSGFVDVDNGTTQHKKYKNVWSVGDSSSLPTSKTVAAISAEAPVLVANVLQAVADGGSAEPIATYDGYTSCPLLTEYGKVLLAEFHGPGYGGQPKETFSAFGLDQAVPRRAFYHLKKDFFPWVYYNSHVKGTWQGPKGLLNPSKLAPASARGFHSAARRSLPTAPQSIASKRSFSSSTATHRNLPARRPRDPLDSDPTAVRHRLPTGETFIARPPPSLPSQYTTTLVPNPILHGAAPTLANTILPPPLKPASPTAPANASPLNAQQIAQMQTLRQQDPKKWSAGALAKRFGCSPLFVRIAAPAPKGIKEERLAAMAAVKQTWGLRKRITQAERAERRKFW